MFYILNILVVFFLQQSLGVSIEGVGWTWINNQYSTDECIDDYQDLQYCHEVWDPVCGFDMVTYPSCCFARVSGVKNVVTGMECPGYQHSMQTQENSDDFGFLMDHDENAQMRRLLQLSIKPLDDQEELDFITVQDIKKIFPNASATFPRNGRPMNRKSANTDETIIEDTSDNVIETITEIIVGDEDTRVWVQDTNSAPYKYVGQLDVGCTGALIGTRYVLTAAHCIMTRYGGQLSELNFTPGKNGDQEPFGKFEWFEAYVPVAWKENKNASSDFAVIVYKERISDVLGGYFGFQTNCDKEFYILNILGYPSDVRPRDQQYVTSCQEVQLQCDQDVIIHTCDTFGGMSGGPMIAFRRDADPPFNIKTIHTGGNTQLQKNFGTNVNPKVLQEIQDYIKYAEQNLAEALDTLFMKN